MRTRCQRCLALDRMQRLVCDGSSPTTTPAVLAIGAANLLGSKKPRRSGVYDTIFLFMHRCTAATCWAFFGLEGLDAGRASRMRIAAYLQWVLENQIADGTGPKVSWRNWKQFRIIAHRLGELRLIQIFVGNWRGVGVLYQSRDVNRAGWEK